MDCGLSTGFPIFANTMSSEKYSFGCVMIVDDSEIDVLVNRRLMELTRFAGSIIIARNGAEALNYLQTECLAPDSAPDWIFLDMHLPVLSGPGFVEAFKELPENIRKKSRIVVLSVLQQPELLEEILRNDFVFGRMEKPLSQQALAGLAARFSDHPVSS